MLRLKGSDRHPLLGLWFCAASMFGQGVEGIPWYLTTNQSSCYIGSTLFVVNLNQKYVPSFVSTRLLVISWWTFVLLMVSCYTANLAAFLTISRIDSSINSAEDLVNQNKILYGTFNGSSIRILNVIHISYLRWSLIFLF